MPKQLTLILQHVMRTKPSKRPCGGKGLPDDGKAYAAPRRVLKGMVKSASKICGPDIATLLTEQRHNTGIDDKHRQKTPKN
ncbi:MAG: hypothetical protein COA75_11360 [Cellvibrionales bacterium]|nr:MAG: hypothetical protein COA75_11360 [Cellvibrionales bacterium]